MFLEEPCDVVRENAASCRLTVTRKEQRSG